MKTAEISLEEMKSQVLSMVNASNDLEALGKVRDMLEEFRKKNTVVGYRPGGFPITEWDMEQQVEKSSAEVKGGNFRTLDEAKRHFGV